MNSSYDSSLMGLELDADLYWAMHKDDLKIELKKESDHDEEAAIEDSSEDMNDDEDISPIAGFSPAGKGY